MRAPLELPFALLTRPDLRLGLLRPRLEAELAKTLAIDRRHHPHRA